MNAHTQKAIEAALKASGSDDFTIDDSDGLKITAFIECDGYTDPDGYEVQAGRFMDFEIESHQLGNGRWMLAHWSERHSQWQSSDFSASFAKYNPQAVYCFSRSIEGLAGDIKTYRSATEAVKTALADRYA